MTYDPNTDPLAIAVDALKQGNTSHLVDMARFAEFMNRRPVLTNPATYKDIKRVSVSNGMACQTITFKGDL